MREEEMGVNAQFLVEMEKEKCGSVWKEVKQASIDTFKVHTYVESVNDDDEKYFIQIKFEEHILLHIQHIHDIRKSNHR